RRAVDVDDREWARVTQAPQATPPASQWRIGQSVRHAKFGVGVIIDARGRGTDTQVQVNFRDAGVKWLAPGYAKPEAAQVFLFARKSATGAEADGKNGSRRNSSAPTQRMSCSRSGRLARAKRTSTPRDSSSR